MRQAILIVTLAMIQGAPLGIMLGQSQPFGVRAKFRGAYLKWIHVAEPEFHKQKLDLSKYMISVVEDPESMTVMLTSLDAIPGARGSSGTHAGYFV